MSAIHKKEIMGRVKNRRFMQPTQLVSAAWAKHHDWPRHSCYIAGPMTGIPGFNYQAFDAARDQLVSEGWDVVSPADLDRINIGVNFEEMTGMEDLSEHIHAFARQDITALLCVDAVFLLENWWLSTGAQNEARIATMLGVPCYRFSDRNLVKFDARFSNSGNA